MITSQRLIIIFVLFNILTGIVATIYSNPTAGSTDKTQIITEADNLQNTAGGSMTDNNLYGGISNTNLVGETSIGNPLGWGTILINVFAKGFNPIAILPNQTLTEIENIFIVLLGLMKAFINVILILEIYMIFKNKKTS